MTKGKNRSRYIIAIAVVLALFAVIPFVSAAKESCPFDKENQTSLTSSAGLADKFTDIMSPMNVFSFAYSRGPDSAGSRTFTIWAQTTTSPAHICQYMRVRAGVQKWNGNSWDMLSYLAENSGTYVSSRYCSLTLTVPSAGTYRIASCHEATMPGHNPSSAHYDDYSSQFDIT